MNSRIRPGERHANIVDYYCNSALVRRWGRLLRIFPLGSRRRRRIRRRRTVGHSYSVPNAQAVSGCISIGDESQAKPAGCSTLTRPTKSKLFYSCSLPILWLLAVVADHLQTRHDQMILRRGVAGRATALRVLRDCTGHGDCVPHVRTKRNGLAAKIPRLAIFVCERVDICCRGLPRSEESRVGKES